MLAKRDAVPAHWVPFFLSFFFFLGAPLSINPFLFEQPKDVQDRRDPQLDSHRCGDNSEKTAIELRMRLAVVVKRKVITFEWMHRDQEFREVQEFSLPDQPKVRTD